MGTNLIVSREDGRGGCVINGTSDMELVIWYESYDYNPRLCNVSKFNSSQTFEDVVGSHGSCNFMF